MPSFSRRVRDVASTLVADRRSEADRNLSGRLARATVASTHELGGARTFSRAHRGAHLGVYHRRDREAFGWI